MDEAQDIAEFIYGLEGFQDAIGTRGRMTTFAPGSRNLIPDEDNNARPFKGVSFLGDGARLMFLAGDTWAGLADTGGQNAAGSLFSWFADMLIYCGYGQVVYDGSNIPGQFASSLIKLLLRWGGSYTSPNSGPFVAGLPQPSAPTVGLIDTTIGGVPTTNGSYSFKIAWIRTTTFGRSIASPTSATVIAQGKGVYLVPPVNAVSGDLGKPSGATNMVVFVTKKNFAGLGLHYRLVRANPFTGLEYNVSDIQRKLTDVSVTNGSNVINSPSAAFTAADIGKRFRPDSAGFTVPAATLIASINSPTQAVLTNPVTVTSGANPRTASINSYVGGFDCGVLLNWQESDLTDEDAWIEDYAPPPCSHVFPLEKVLGGITDADSFDPASGTNRGTSAIFSLRNLPESFNPLHKIYLPQKVVDLQHRGLDSYVFVGCKAYIGAFQYIDVAGSAPATLTTILPDEGISSRSNWCITDDGLYIFTAKGVAKRVIANGIVDAEFSILVRRWMKRWINKEKVTVARYADAQSVAYIYENEAFLYNTQTKLWSSLIYLDESFPAINIISALGVQGTLLMSGYEPTISPTNTLLFDFDAATANAGPVAAIPHFTDVPDRKRTKTINKIAPQFNADRADRPVFVTLHINDKTTFVDDAQMTNGSDILNSATAKFTAKSIGDYVLVKGAGAGNTFLRARIRQYISPTQVRLGTVQRVMASSIALNASATVTGAYCVIAHRIYQFTPKLGINRPPAKDIFVNGVKSYAVGIVMDTIGQDATPLSCDVVATINPETHWKTY